MDVPKQPPRPSWSSMLVASRVSSLAFSYFFLASILRDVLGHNIDCSCGTLINSWEYRLFSSSLPRTWILNNVWLSLSSIIGGLIVSSSSSSSSWQKGWFCDLWWYDSFLNDLQKKYDKHMLVCDSRYQRRISKRVWMICMGAPLSSSTLSKNPRLAFSCEAPPQKASWTSREQLSSCSVSNPELPQVQPGQRFLFTFFFWLFLGREASSSSSSSSWATLNPSSQWSNPQLAPFYFSSERMDRNHHRGNMHNLNGSFILIVHKAMHPLNAPLSIECPTMPPHTDSPWCRPEQLVKVE